MDRLFSRLKRMGLVQVGLLLGVSYLLLALSYFSVNKNYGSDPELTLLVAQTILEQGTMRLDGYVGREVLGRPFATFINSSKMVERNGHLYSYFPTGPAVLVLPVVAAVRTLGWDMSRIDGNYVLQGYLASFSVVIVFLVMYQTACLFLDERASLLISLTATAGSTIMSTMGTALWSINFATIFVALVLYMLAKGVASWSRFTPYGLGLLLFLAFFARVSTAAFIAPVLVYLLIYERKVVGKTAVAALMPLILFLAWSRWEFGQWLPSYYSAARLVVQRTAMWVGVLGNLFSPSRGIFVFSSFLGLGVVGGVWQWRWWGKRPLIPLVLVWFGLLLLVIARGASWWGGASFGPRILTEMVPGLALLVVFVWRDLLPVFGELKRKVWVVVYTLLAILAIGIHSFQGLFNAYTAQWNGLIDPIPKLSVLGWGDLFEWQYSQILASPDWNCAIVADRTRVFVEELSVLTPYRWGQAMQFNETGFNDSLKIGLQQLTENQPTVTNNEPLGGMQQLFLPFMTHLTNHAVLLGFKASGEDGLAESRCRELQMIFRLQSFEEAAEAMVLSLVVEAYGEQQMLVTVNGVLVGEMWLREDGSGATAVTFAIPSDLLNFDGLNEIEITLPDATFTGPRGSGYQSLIFSQAILYPTEATNLHPALTSPSAYP